MSRICWCPEHLWGGCKEEHELPPYTSTFNQYLSGGTMPNCFSHDHWYQDGDECPICVLSNANKELQARIVELEAENQMLKARLMSLTQDPNPPYHYA